jgi:molecular chaperone GrpE
MAHNTSNKAKPPAQEQSAENDVLIAENASLRDRMLRALAEAENTRRRADRAAADAGRYAITDFARELVAVADNLQRTLAAAERPAFENAADVALIEGVRATQRMLMQVLERFGVRKIEALGQPFDPALHEAVLEVEDPSHPPGTVVSVVEDGYTINDRLLRAARVAVSKHRGEAPSAEPTAEAPTTDPRSHPPDHPD